MKKSFYHFLIKFRDVNDEIGEFANAVYQDHSFPKYSCDYQELSSYLELNGEYLPTLVIFDQAWERYVESENK